MQLQKVRLNSCSLNPGELHQLNDFGYFHPVFACTTGDGDQFTARMRLHICENLSKLIFADPRAFEDGGFSVNSAGSNLIRRVSSFSQGTDINKNPLLAEIPDNLALYQITSQEIEDALLGGYQMPANPPDLQVSKPSFAFTCHDPSIRGGGNAILFRFINWLAGLGIHSTIYSCGAIPEWKSACARFRLFSNYKDMCAAIEEDFVILFSMWHIEPMLQAHPAGKKIYHLRQVVESSHYGIDFASMLSPKPVIDLLERLPLGSITISPFLQKYYHLRNNRSVPLITNGIDCSLFRPTLRDSKNFSVVNILSVGNPDHFVKGASVLSTALAMLARKKPDTHFRWHLVSGQAHRFSPDWIGNLQNLRLLSFVDLSPQRMRALYNDADIFVNAALHEGFGLPSLEAMACGIPVIQADNDGLRGIVKSEHDCLMVPVNDPDVLFQAMTRLLDDPDLQARLRKNGRDTAQNHSLSHQFKEFVECFSHILNISFPADKRKALQDSLGGLDETPLPMFSKDSPLVSVVIPSFNQAAYLSQALDSLLQQTYANWEAVVVNDGSTDNTVEILEAYQKRDSRIRGFTKSNGGITSALNYGIHHARGEFFCWLSSDDLFYPEKIELQVRSFEHLSPDYALIYGNFDILHEEDHRIEVLPHSRPLVPGAEFAEAFKFDFIDGCTIMVRMDVLREIGGFNPYYRHSQDMELWIRIASYKYRFSLLDKKVTIRRVHESQASTGNMIHCRYDAAWIVNYYLRHFSLQEIYWNFDLTKAEDIEQVIIHLVGRTLHTEANINHPLVQEIFWNWIETGLFPLEEDIRRCILARIFLELIKNRSVSPKLQYYIDRCRSALIQGISSYKLSEAFYSKGPRHIRWDDRESDDFSRLLFDYACNLLVNSHTPLFAQELHHHNTNLKVNTPRKLAQSVLQYLSQFANLYQFTARSCLPEFENASCGNLLLFCFLRYFQHIEAFRRSLDFDFHHNTSPADLNSLDNSICCLPLPVAQDLGRICSQNPDEPMLYYWHALMLAANRKFHEATQEGWKALKLKNYNGNWSIAHHVANWAEKAGDYKDADRARSMAAALNPSLSIADFEDEAKGEFSLPQLLPELGKTIFSQDYSELPDAPISSCRFIPRQDNSYALRMEVSASKDNFFVVECKGSLDQPFRAILVTDPFSGLLYKVNTRLLYEFWLNGYDFTREVRTLQHRTDDAIPSVAFTVKWTSGVGGGPAMVYRFANWLTELGIRTTIYSSDPFPDWTDLKAVYKHIADDAARYAAIDETIVIAYSVLELPSILRYSNTKNKAIYHLCQGAEDHNYHGGDYPSLLARKNLFDLLHCLPVGRIVVSQHLDRLFKERFNQKAYVIENGIDLKIFRPFIRKITARKVRVLAVGNPERPLKGIMDVREALFLLKRGHPDMEFHLDVVTGAASGSSEELLTGPSAFSLSFHSRLSPAEMCGMYRQSDVLVNPAWYEGFGLPSLEAMACGTPVIQADNQGLYGIVEHEVNCLIVKPNCPQDISYAIGRLLEDDHLRMRLIEGGRTTALKHAVVRQFEDFVSAFESILGHSMDEPLVSFIRSRLQGDTTSYSADHELDPLLPLFSIIIPTYNHAAFLPEALNSLLNQSYPKWEAIMVDDGSTDDSPAIMDRYAGFDSRFKSIHKTNGGAASALNTGLCHASGDWICWLSSDDIFESDALDNFTANILKHPQNRFFHSAFSTLNNATGEKVTHREFRHEYLNPALQSLMLLQLNFINGISVAIHRSLFEEAGPFREDLRNGQDFDMWLRMSRLTRFQYIHHPTCISREHASAGSSVFLEAGLFDGANACMDFLNTHSFEVIFPFSNLENAVEGARILRHALGVVASPQALMYQGIGFLPVFTGRIREWLDTMRPLDSKTWITPILKEFAASIQTSDLPEELKFHCLSLIHDQDGLFRYKPFDYLSEMELRLSRLESQKEEISSHQLRKYLDRRKQCIRSISPSYRTVLQTKAEGELAAPIPMVSDGRTTSPLPEVAVDYHAQIHALIDAILAARIREVIVYGAGRVGRVFLSLARANSLAVRQFVDSNSDLWGKSIDGIDIVSLDRAMESGGDIYAIASLAYCQEISDRIKSAFGPRRVQIFSPSMLDVALNSSGASPVWQNTDNKNESMDWLPIVREASAMFRKLQPAMIRQSFSASVPPQASDSSLDRMRQLAITAAGSKVREVWIYGAGTVGRQLHREATAIGLCVCGFIDSNPAFWGKKIEGIDIVSLSSAVTGSKHAYLVGSLARAAEIRSAILNAYRNTSCRPQIFTLESEDIAYEPWAAFSVVTYVPVNRSGNTLGSR
jgi:glycosyltransferase involved in cell wall biosynthesis